MPRNIRKDIQNARELLTNADAVLIVTGAGMSVDKKIFISVYYILCELKYSKVYIIHVCIYCTYEYLFLYMY